MPIFYTADRSGQLSSGLIINPTPLPDVSLLNTQLKASDIELQGFIARYYPFGISRHGSNYLLQNSHRTVNFGNGNFKTFVDVSCSIEATYEMARQIYAPEAPSRMCCMFATETAQEARAFGVDHGNGSANIYEVHPRARTFKADMNLLHFSVNMVETLALAEKYWTQQSTQSPSYEILVELPAEIGALVQ